MTQCQDLGLSNGAEGLKRKRRQWKIKPGLGGLDPAGLREMLTMSAKRSTGIASNCSNGFK